MIYDCTRCPGHADISAEQMATLSNSEWRKVSQNFRCDSCLATISRDSPDTLKDRRDWNTLEANLMVQDCRPAAKRIWSQRQ